MSSYVSNGAVISSCGNYRYRLWREWRGTGRRENWDWWAEDDGRPALDGAGEPIGEPLSCLFVMLNPSTADADQDDPTIRRCVGFAKSLGYDRLDVVNLFAWRATNPREVLAMTGGKTDPVGAENQRHFHEALTGAGIVICAWGASGSHLDQDETALGWIESFLEFMDEREVPICALRLSKEGHPCHPLYLPSDLKPFRFSGRRRDQ